MTFDVNAPAKQMSARKMPWRPLAFAVGGAIIVGAAVTADGTIIRDWWPEKEERKRTADKPVVAAFDMGTSNWTPAPPLAPEPVLITTERIIDRPVITTVAVAAPAPPPAPAPAVQVAAVSPVRPVGLGGPMIFVAEHAPPPMLDGRVPILQQGCMLHPGDVIYAALLDEVRWDMGGQIAATVTRPVVSAERPTTVLIPAGATLIGQTNPAKLQRGTDMAPAPTWTQVSWVDSDTGMYRARRLQATGANASGVNGIGGEVNAQWGTIIGLMAITTFFDTVSGININLGSSSDNSISATVGGSAAGRIGEQVARQVLDVQPQITTPAGTQILALPSVQIRMC